MTHPESKHLSDAVPASVPVLRAVLSEADLPPSLMAALDARELDRARFMGLGDELVNALRPELERLTVQTVQRAMHHAWVSRFRSDLD